MPASTAARRMAVLAAGVVITAGSLGAIQLLLNRSDAARRAQTDIAELDQRAVSAAALQLVFRVSPASVIVLGSTLTQIERDLVTYTDSVRPEVGTADAAKLRVAVRSYLRSFSGGPGAAQRALASPLTSGPYVQYLQLSGQLSALSVRLQQSADTARAEATVGTVAILIACMAAIGLLGMRFQAERDRASRYAVQATTDSLTGLGNHRAFHQKLALSLDSGLITLMLLDLDGLKRTNDGLGHQAGDARIVALARALRDGVRAGDAASAFRIGGDEFAVILPAASSATATRLADDLAAGTHPMRGDTGRVAAGVAEAIPGDAPATLVKRADEALIRAKRSSSQIIIWSADVPSDEAPDEEPRYAAIADVLAHAIDTRDRGVQSHAQVVASLAFGIAMHLGLDARSAEHVRLAGLLHDVGKIGIPDAILHKRGSLTTAERRTMSTHPRLGEALARGAGLPDDVAAAIGHHHEHWDGTGYPDGLRATQIPIGARILLVADAYEAMTSGRPYRRRVAQTTALDELDRCAATQFDPSCVAALKEILVAGAKPNVAFAS